LFFGPDGESGPERQVREAKAKAICRHCPVTWQCASYAVRQPEKWGVWGAAGEAERATMRRNYLRHLKGYAA
jgi:WhiB family redox-sensing transcriptional regulator